MEPDHRGSICPHFFLYLPPKTPPVFSQKGSVRKQQKIPLVLSDVHFPPTPRVTYFCLRVTICWSPPGQGGAIQPEEEVTQNLSSSPAMSFQGRTV